MTFSINKKWGAIFIIALFLISCSETEKRPVRILTGGIRHESNTFSTDLTREGDFTVIRGEEVLESSEWAEHFSGTEIRFIPTLHAYARPYGVVSQEAFEKFMEEIIEGVRQAGEIDGIYLDMHGALHAEGYEDAQEYFVKEIRKVAGKDVLISGSFDLHGNMSSGFVNELDILTAFRTAPHVDGNETKIRAIQLLTGAVKNSMKPVIAHIPVPVLIPGEKGITFVEPLYSIYESLPEISEKKGILDASVFIGCAWSDLERTSITVQVVAEDPSYMTLAENEAKKLAADIWNIRSDLEFEVPVAVIDDAIDIALDDPAQTVYISDSGDNTTAGAAGDIPLVLERLIANGAKDAVVAGIVDREAVLECIENGTGSNVKLNIGGKLDTVFGSPLPVDGFVKSITQTSHNDTAAVVSTEGIDVVLMSQRRSFTRIRDFNDVNIDPLGYKIVVVKLGYLYPELREIAPKSIMALTPGMAYQVVEKLPYENIRRPVYPLDPDMEWDPYQYLFPESDSH